VGNLYMCAASLLISDSFIPMILQCDPLRKRQMGQNRHIAILAVSHPVCMQIFYIYFFFIRFLIFCRNKKLVLIGIHY